MLYQTREALRPCTHCFIVTVLPLRHPNLHHYPVEVAAHEVAGHLTYIYNKEGRREEHVGGSEKEIEGVGDAVGEAAEDEDGHTEEHAEHLSLPGKLHGGGHDEAAADGKDEAGSRSFGHPRGGDGRGGVYAVGLRIADGKCREQAAGDVTCKHGGKHGPVAAPADESCRACIEFQGVIDHGGETEREEHGTGHAARPQIHNAADRDADAGENGRREYISEHSKQNI